MTDYDKLFIGGRWVAPATDQRLEVFSPATEARVGSVPVAAPADIDAAVAAARAALEAGPWAETTPAAARRDPRQGRQAHRGAQRGADLHHLRRDGRAGIGRRGDAEDHVARDPQLLRRARRPSSRGKRSAPAPFGQSKIYREPVGVVGAVIAWNVPLFLAINKLAPALLAGCTVVLKPAPETPLDANMVADIFTEAGLPEGVLSIVPGGAETGEYLVSHPDVDKVTFTGSTAVGRKIGAIAAEQLKRCSLELGGKSAAILLEDMDVAATVPMLVMSGLMNTGQACVGQTRILAPRSRYDEIIEAMVQTAGFMPVGDPADPSARQLGPLITEKQRDKVLGYIEKGKAEGARVVLGGGVPADLDTGWFVEPTIFADVDNSMTIAREEIFGPVLSVIPYDTVDEAVKIANDSEYGLAGSVYTTDIEKGIEIAKQIRTGTYAINWYAFDPGFPFGGFKNSGIGRENGPEGLEAYCELKSVLMPPGYTG